MNNQIANLHIYGGHGDWLQFSSLVKHYADTHKNVFLSSDAFRKELFELLFYKYDNIKMGNNVGTPKHNLTWEEAVDHKSWRNIDWKRDKDLEESLYEEIIRKFGKEYIIIHERPLDNCNRKMLPINREYIGNKNLPVINMDINWLKANKLSICNVLHYKKVVNNAKEIHTYEGCWHNFCDSVVENQSIKLFHHLYCKPYLFDEQMVHNRVIKLIEQNKWNKLDWKYIYD